MKSERQRTLDVLQWNPNHENNVRYACTIQALDDTSVTFEHQDGMTITMSREEWERHGRSSEIAVALPISLEEP